MKAVTLDQDAVAVELLRLLDDLGMTIPVALIIPALYELGRPSPELVERLMRQAIEEAGVGNEELLEIAEQAQREVEEELEEQRLVEDLLQDVDLDWGGDLDRAA